MYLAWLPMRTPFLRLLAAATERALWLLDRDTPITGLAAQGDRILISTCVPGLDRPLAAWNAWNLHFLVVVSVAFTLAGPARRGRLARLALVLGVSGFLALILSFAEVSHIAALAARDTFGLVLDRGTADTLLEGMGKTIIVLGMLAVPAFTLLTSYVGSWSDAQDTSHAPAARGVVMLVLILGGVLVALLAATRPPDPLDALRRIQALNPSSPRPSFSLGVYQEAQGRLEAAADAYRTSLGIDPAFAEARYGLGNVLHGEGRLQEAEGAYREALRIDPEHISARENLGIALYEQGDYTEAARCFSEVIRREPRHAAAQHNLGMTLLGLDRRCDALPYLRRGSSLDGRFARDVTLRVEIARLEEDCRRPR